MKNLIYRVVKKIAPWLGVHMNKQIFSNAVGRAVPIVGGIFAGGLTYATFKPCSNRLKATLRELPISDPEFYKSGAYENTEPVDVTDLYEVEDEEDNSDSEIGYYVDTSTPPPYDISILFCDFLFLNFAKSDKYCPFSRQKK